MILYSAIRCSSCPAVWDEDEDAGKHFESLDGEYYCIGECLNNAQKIAHRRELVEMASEKLREILSEIEALDKEYPEAEDDGPGNPYAMIDDALRRVRLYGEGKDTGWRDGLMLSRDEAREIQYAIERGINSASFNLRWDLGLFDNQPTLRIGHLLAGIQAKDIAHMGGQLLNLNEWRERTDKGTSL